MKFSHALCRAIVKAWPLKHGQGRLIDTVFKGVTPIGDTLKITTTDGLNFKARNDLIGRHLYLSGAFDQSVSDTLIGLAKPGDTLLDVGSNIGYVSARFLAHVPQSKAVAIEPQPGLLDIIRENLSPFAGRARVVSAALSDTRGEGHLAINNQNLGASKLSNDGVRVPLMTPGDLNLDRADLIKIDVEGHEFEVITALAPLFDQLKTRAVLFECAGPVERVITPMTDRGYKVFALKKRLFTLERVPVSSGTVANDYLAVRERDR